MTQSRSLSIRPCGTCLVLSSASATACSSCARTSVARSRRQLRASTGAPPSTSSNPTRVYSPEWTQSPTRGCRTEIVSSPCQKGAKALASSVADGRCLGAPWLVAHCSLAYAPAAAILHRFEATGTTDHCPFASCENVERQLYGLQFHPEVTHSVFGETILGNFIDSAGLKGSWRMDDFITEQVRAVPWQSARQV